MPTRCKKFQEVIDESGEEECEGATGTCRKARWSELCTRVERRASGTSHEGPSLKVYEESNETHLDSSAAVNLCSTTMVAPQCGQC